MNDEYTHSTQSPLELRYISKLLMKNERIWSYVKETTNDSLDLNVTLHSCNTLPADVHEGMWFLSKIWKVM
jgi:hypothetical protein